MAIDTYFTWVNTGSRVTSAATAHNIFGTYGGLSDLSASEVIVLQVLASGGDFRLSANPAVGATDDVGLFIGVSASIVDLPPMVRNEASQITIAREGANNPVAQWVIWRRVP